MILSQFRQWALASCLASASLLVACGGGSSSSNTPPTVTGSQSGILTDAAVQGVSYRTSSGVTGVTGPNGEYNFNLGDTVQFTLGGLTLGNVTATGIISPIQLADGDSNKLNNLLVLFQSLDTDGNPSNGITISTSAANAVPSGLNLSISPSTFASGSNTALVSSMQAGGITRTVTSQASATAHFKEQGLKLLSANVIVMYDANSAAMIRVLENGSYLIGEAAPDDYTGAQGEMNYVAIGQAGVERGSLSVTGFSTTGYQVTATINLDTNLQGGLSHPVSCDEQGFLPNGEGFKINVAGLCEGEETGQLLNKAPNVNSSLVGVWALGSSNSATVEHFVFLPNGKYLMVDPVNSGIEFGTYVWNSTTGQITISNVIYDTNGTAGLQDLSGFQRIDRDGVTPIVDEGNVINGFFSGTIVLTNNGLQATVTPTGESAQTLYRISK